jgi:hypothetical protein
VETRPKAKCVASRFCHVSKEALESSIQALSHGKLVGLFIIKTVKCVIRFGKFARILENKWNF